jgi:hypothetical protein
MTFKICFFSPKVQFLWNILKPDRHRIAVIEKHPLFIPKLATGLWKPVGIKYT